MNKQLESLHEHKNRYRNAGLVQVSAWIPVEYKSQFLEECRRLRERHLAKLALQNEQKLTIFNEEQI